MLNVTLRPAKLGPSINTRSERHGEDENVPAIDITVSGIMLDREEVGDLTEDPELALALFKQQTDQVDVPRFADFGPMLFKHKFTDAKVSFELGLHKQSVRLSPCKVRKIQLEAVLGGMLEMSCRVQCAHEVAPDLSKLAVFMNQEVKIAISDGALDRKTAEDTQGNLALEGGGNADPPPPSEDEPPPSRPRRSRAPAPSRATRAKKSKGARRRAA